MSALTCYHISEIDADTIIYEGEDLCNFLSQLGLDYDTDFAPSELYGIWLDDCLDAGKLRYWAANHHPIDY